jgi:PKD repeat protein
MLLIRPVNVIFVALTLIYKRNPNKNIPFRLIAILFSICLLCLSTGICRPNVLEAAITPEYLDCGTVSMNGCVGTNSCINCSVTHFSWDWGDGTVADSWWPATHHYQENGSYAVTVTAFCSTGLTQSSSITINITNAGVSLSSYGYYLKLYPSTLILRRGKTYETLHLELRDADGLPVSLNDKVLSFTSSNPSVVQVNSSGVVTAFGFGEAEITATVEGFPLTAKASVFAGEFRIEPPILFLSLNGQPTGQLNLKVANADGSPLDLAGRNVKFSGLNEDVAQVNNSGLVTAIRMPLSDAEWPRISAEIDGTFSNNGAIIRVSPDPLNLDMIVLQEPNITYYIAKQFGPFNYQQIFQDFDVPCITNIGYKLSEELCGTVPYKGDVQYLLNTPYYEQKGEYMCGGNGNPVLLGTAIENPANGCLIASDRNGTPPAWGAIFHEMGHNFTQVSRSFREFMSWSNMENSNFVYNEALASVVYMYVGKMMNERSTQYQIPTYILSTITKNIEQTHLDKYIKNGAKYSEIEVSDIFDITLLLAEKYGYSILPRFFSVFLPPDATFSRFCLNNSDAGQATFFVAAMSAAAGTYLRSDFVNKWGFPVDNSTFDQIYPQLIRLVAQHEPLPGTPKIIIKQRSLNFGSLKTGSISNPKTITIRNTGKGNLMIYSIIIDGTNAGEFQQSNDCLTLFPGELCTINVTFSPTVPFTKKSATIRIASNDPKKTTVNVKLSGRASLPKISVFPKSLNFGSVHIGDTATQIITIRNIGISDLGLNNNIGIRGANAGEFSQTNDCSTVPAGNICTITVTFKPTTPSGTKKATINIYSNDPKKTTVNVKIKGTGI